MYEEGGAQDSAKRCQNSESRMVKMDSDIISKAEHIDAAQLL